MTLIAGCFSLSNKDPISGELKSSLNNNLRRDNDSQGQTYCFDQDGFFLVKWDSGAFGEEAWLEGVDGSITTLVGDPIYSEKGERIPRDEQLQKLGLFQPGVVDKLAKSRGSFCLLAYSPLERRLKISTDALGIRSVYYLIQDGVFIFSSTLRLLEASKVIRKQISVVGVAEQCIYSQPLGLRSPYKNISILRESELLSVSSNGIEISNYYDWSSIGLSSKTEDQAAEWLYQLFVDGVRLRALPKENAFAFLSGGMDSRAIVASLIDCGHLVFALNFSPEDSQDQGYAVQFAEKAGGNCRLFCLPRDADPNFSLLAYKAKLLLEKSESLNSRRRQIIWSGDGGSVGLGHVYMDERMVEICETQGVESAIKYFTKLHRHFLPTNVFSAPWRKRLPDTIHQNLIAEFERYTCDDVARKIYLFLLFNDQRRHLFKHFETIDEHGLEFLTPFFDTVFLRGIISTPVRWGVLHKLYAIWFTHLPEFAQLTPWQTYRGHVKCPVPVSDNLSYQWVTQSDLPVEKLRDRLKLAREIIKSSNTPMVKYLFSKTRLLVAALFHVLRIRDGKYTLQTIEKIQRFEVGSSETIASQ